MQSIQYSASWADTVCSYWFKKLEATGSTLNLKHKEAAKSVRMPEYIDMSLNCHNMVQNVLQLNMNIGELLIYLILNKDLRLQPCKIQIDHELKDANLFAQMIFVEKNVKAFRWWWKLNPPFYVFIKWIASTVFLASGGVWAGWTLSCLDPVTERVSVYRQEYREQTFIYNRS